MSNAIKTNIVRTGEYRFTKDGVFAINPITSMNYKPEFQTNSNSLYIKNNYIIDSNSALANLINGNFIVKKNTNIQLSMKLSGLDIVNSYDEYAFHRPLKDERKYDEDDLPIDDDDSINENDCLKFGECLTFANQKNDMNTFNKLLKAINSPPVLQSTSSEMPFGATEFDKDNIKILETIDDNEKNNFAVPVNGESYAIVRRQIVNNFAAYHIAFVLYTHNNVNITLEAEADNKNNYQPKFSFYDINPNGYTFHRRWSAELFKNSTNPDEIERYNALYNNGETIVLKSRSINDVLKEIDEENNIVSPPLNVKRKRTTTDEAFTKRKRTGGKKYRIKTKKLSKKRYKKKLKPKTKKRQVYI